METIKLSRPLKVNGTDYRELQCDLDAITVDDFATAEKRSDEKKNGSVSVVETDYTFHLYLGMEGIMKAMPEMDIADLERLTGRDLTKVMAAGRFFFFGSEDEDSTGESSDEPSESTPKRSTAASTK